MIDLTPYLQYSVVWEDPDNYDLWDALCAVGLGASTAGVYRDDRWTLYFDFSCGCEECLPLPETVDQARELVEARLRELGVEFEIKEAGMYSSELDEFYPESDGSSVG